ncbi:hypothetical protein C8F04DRAFT_1076744 [Mycena alexandri]|uniref:Uncharacterized protein n=1 Tax=Mycena alexandri TaxID=1745969 RepID=A0AAD6XAG6_9AGAR|nr:hypothetical protein C8F04DRAFT_1076744 [Mycena alexandri]
MAQRTVDSRWTPREDELLTRAVANFGEHDNWKTVAQAVPGRTNKACRKRWLHSLSPAVKKSAWTPSEDRLLIELYAAHGPKWSAIARQIHGRTDDACSKRYREALDPNLKKDEWTTAEDAQLMQAYDRIGGKWGQVGQELRRSGLGCRNRWRMLERNRQKALQAAAQQAAIFDGTQSQFLHGGGPHESLGDVWPVYCPPEAYHSALGSELSHGEHCFRESTPQMPDSPEVPPFNFASSSLSAALSDPPRTSLPLPPIPDEETFDNHPYDSEPEPFASTSYPPTPAPPPPPSDPVPYELDTISPAQLSLKHCGSNSQTETFTSSRTSNFSSPPASSTSSPRWRSPLISSTDSLPSSDDSRPPGLVFDHIPPDTSGPDASSSSSSPFIPPSSLSPADSPIPCSPIDLPPIDHLPADSLLFSASYYYRMAPSMAPSKRQKKDRPRKPPKAAGEVRLSSLLPLSSDHNVRAYACGREPCWPSAAEIGHVCFSTSKELLEHSRMIHGEGEDSVSDRPYRCALAGCGKSWKTLNGLQYHLQISTAHFRNAVSSTFRSADGGDNMPSATPSQDGEAGPDAQESRSYICHHPQCFKAYKQPSGLRYHLKHGHPPDLPAQLEMVPPTLAREIPNKTRKMRRKGEDR